MSIAVADVVRTSLGPRGMDKMVSPESSPILARTFALHQTAFANLLFPHLDPNPQGQGADYQRWCHDPQADGGHPPHRKNGK